MSGTRESREGTTHDVTHEEEYAEVVGLAQTFYALVNVLRVETMVSQAAKRSHQLILSLQVK